MEIVEGGSCLRACVFADESSILVQRKRMSRVAKSLEPVWIVSILQGTIVKS